MGHYVSGSGLEIPGLEAILEYGNSEQADGLGRIAGALRINDNAQLERIRVTQIDGLHDDPDGRDTRSANSDSHGERAGVLFYGGKTIGLTGYVEAGNVPAMRDLWRRFRSQFGTIERDLLIHPVGEEPAWRNLVHNPRIRGLSQTSFISSHWSAVSSSGSPVLSLDGWATGVFAINLAVTPTGSGTASATYSNNTTGGFVYSTWSGEDVFVDTLVKVSAVSGGTVSSVALCVAEKNAAGTTNLTTVVTQASPVTGTIYHLKARVLAASLRADTVSVSIAVRMSFSAAGTYQLVFGNTALVLLDALQAAPASFFDGATAGFAWVGSRYDVESVGPVTAVNQFVDPLSDQTGVWSASNSAGVTVNSGPVSTKRWHGGDSASSVYYNATSDATTGRTVSIATATTGIMARAIISGRTYRFSFRARGVSSPVLFIDAHIQWLDAAGTAITDTAASVDFGPNLTVDASVTGVAPANAFGARLRVGWLDHPTTASTQTLEFYLTDPCLLDVSDVDPGSFVGLGNPEHEVVTYSASTTPPTPNGARRRIVRPFLVRNVRKTSDAKAPEQQGSLRARRPFTMSLRASDPRVYSLDEQSRNLQMLGSSSLYVEQAPSNFTLDTAGLPVPTGWTYEGHFITNASTSPAIPFVWSRQQTHNYPSYGGLDPNGGVGLKSWGVFGEFGSPAPAQSIVPRMYRATSLYTKPAVVLGTAPSTDDAGSLLPNVFNVAFTGGPAAYWWTWTGIVLKRVSSTTWLELRWNSASHALDPSIGPAGAFELWCSHNSSGTLTTTRLAAWDYASYDSSNGRYPFNYWEPQWLKAWMDSSNVVHWELWSTYPSATNTSGRYEQGTYTMPSPIVTLLGASVSGQTGRTMGVMQNAAGSTVFNQLAGFPPFWHYYESIASDQAPQSVACEVVGSVDTPQRIVLKGGLVDPIVQITVPQEDGTTKSSTARFIGTISDNNPVTIATADGGIKVTDSLGTNAYSMLVPGAEFLRFKPGVNYVSLQARDWLTTPDSHAAIFWRDALE